MPIYYPPLLAYIKVFIGSHPNQLLLPSVILILIFLMEVYLFSFSIQLYFKYVLCTCYTHLNGQRMSYWNWGKKKKKQGFIKRLRQMLDEGFSNLATKTKQCKSKFVDTVCLHDHPKLDKHRGYLKIKCPRKRLENGKQSMNSLHHLKQCMTLQPKQYFSPKRLHFFIWVTQNCGIFLKLFLYFSWRLITLQYCNGFCYTLT